MGADDGQLVCDNSILAATAKCSTYAFTRYACGLATRKTSLALSSGSALHAGLAVWLETGDIDKAVETCADFYEPLVDKYLVKIEAKDLPADDKRFSPPWVEAILHQYLTRYKDRWPFKVIRGSTEKPISAPFPGPGEPKMNLPSEKLVTYVARLDAVVRRWESGEKWNLDWKSTRKASDWWIAKQQVSSQFTGQRWLTEQAGIGEVAGCILGVLELPEPHRSENKCKDHKVSYQECSIRHAGSHFVYITRGRAEIEAWKWTARKLIRKYDALLTRAGQDGMAAMPDIPMEGRFNEGCTFCDMKDFCKLGRNVSKASVRATFVDQPWNPLATGED